MKIQNYREKVSGCWLGKNIGGTLGAPMEWYRQANDVSFYTQALDGEPVPNDDLDLQLVWLIALEERGLKIDAHDLAEYWMLYITPHYSEYGTGKSNLRIGLSPPLCGNYRNDYKDSCGAFIRAEIWACIAPGLPDVAASYAYEDACVDHGSGEGTHAAVMIAALESMAFIESDVRKLIETSLSYIPETCGVAAAVRTAIASYDSGRTWQETRDIILEKHRGMAMFGNRHMISQADYDKGFFDGKRGYDAPSNIAIIVAGILYGEGDFAKTVCTTVNFGEDTDCTAATVGAIWGIMHGVDAIPEKWIKPIGRSIKTLCISNSELPYWSPLPKTIDELTDRTIAIGERLLASMARRSDFESKKQLKNIFNRTKFFKLGRLKYEFEDITVFAEFANGPTLDKDKNTHLVITVMNHSRIPATLKFQWHLADNWNMAESKSAVTVCQQEGYNEPVVLKCTLHCDNFTTPSAEHVLSITVQERAKKMLIPITIINTPADN